MDDDVNFLLSRHYNQDPYHSDVSSMDNESFTDHNITGDSSFYSHNSFPYPEHNDKSPQNDTHPSSRDRPKRTNLNPSSPKPTNDEVEIVLPSKKEKPNIFKNIRNKLSRATSGKDKEEKPVESNAHPENGSVSKVSISSMLTNKSGDWP